MSFVFGTPDPTAASASGVSEAAKRVNEAAQRQMQWNRPNSSNPWAAQTSNPDGSVSLGFTGPLAGAQQNLTAEALRSMGTPTDFNQFNVGSGDDYRAQGIAGAESQMNDWLGPLQGGIDSSERQRLLNAGYQEGSPEFQAQMAKGAGSAADLQSTLHNSAIGLGGQLGAKQQAMDLLGKQQGLAEALRQRSLPMEQLAAMRGLLGQPGYSGDDSIMAGATGDLNQQLGHYLGQRQDYETANKEEQEAGMSLGTGLFSSALGMGTNAVSNRAKAPKPPKSYSV